MRPVLLVAVLAAPALTAAQTVPSGAVQFSKHGGQDLVHGPFINAAECPATSSGQISLSWNAALIFPWPASATTQVYVSNTQHPGTPPSPCTTAPNGTDTYAGPVGAPMHATAPAQSPVPYDTGSFVATLNDPYLTCSVAADTPIYVCVQASDATSGVIVGYALGTLTLSTSAPAAPTDVGWSVRPGGLDVAWSAPSGSPAAYDFRVVAEADPPDARDATVHELTDVVALSAELVGLVPGVQYRVQVYARSRAGNESLPAETLGTPAALPTPEFWEGFSSVGCGCGQGAGGPEALVAVLALLAARRRSRR